jgi:hypothetical protein
VSEVIERWPATKRPAIEGGFGGCLNCGPRPSLFPADARIAVGFGMAVLTRDGAHVWSEDGRDWDACLSGAQAEGMAAADPDHDWRIELEGPLSGRMYQRHGPGKWVLIEQSEGFA